MNRKQIVNELFSWPEITEAESARIVASIVNHLKKYPELKRNKTPPKAIREKLKASGALKQPVKSEIKDCIKLGINSVTKSLEQNPTQVKFVLVCRSCKPLVVLTRHLQVMCSYNNIPAGCVYTLSESLSKLFNIKAVGALAFCDSGLNESARLSEAFKSEIIPLIKPITNPFTAQSQNFKIIDQSDIESALKEKEASDINPEQVEMMVEDDENANDNEERQNNFGSDYISFNSSNNQIAFDSTDFILFKDDYVPRRSTMSRMLDDIERDLNEFAGSGYRFNQLSIVTKPRVDRSGKAKKKPDLKGKKMKALEQNKFKNKSAK